MRKRAYLALPLLLVVALAIAGCGQGPGGNGGSYATPDVTMGQENFDHGSLTIAAGTTVKFIDAQSAAPHVLCIGEHGRCDESAPGPSALIGGNSLQVAPGETKEVTFATPGTYKIACTLHPMMSMTITVQ
jgi:plastocyanin